LRNAICRNLQYQPTPSAVRNHQIAAAAEYKQWNRSPIRERHGIRDFIGIHRSGEKLRHSAYAQGGQWRERNVLLNFEPSGWHEMLSNIRGGAEARGLTTR